MQAIWKTTRRFSAVEIGCNTQPCSGAKKPQPDRTSCGPRYFGDEWVQFVFLWRNRIKMEQIIHNNCLTAWTCLKGEFYTGERGETKLCRYTPSVWRVLWPSMWHSYLLCQCTWYFWLAGSMPFRASKQFQTLGTERIEPSQVWTIILKKINKRQRVLFPGK